MIEYLVGDTSDHAKEWAAKEGLIVREPQPNELFIDIDDAAGQAEFERNYDIIDRVVGIKDVKTTPSRSKPEGKHIVVNIRKAIGPLERIVLQSILGSDRRREGHSYARAMSGDKSPTLFFEKP